MKEFSVWYRYGGRTNEMRFLAESFEEARERVLVFKAAAGEPRVHCNGDATPADEHHVTRDNPQESHQSTVAAGEL